MDKQQLWHAINNELELSLSKANYQTWIKDKTSLLSYQAGVVEIGCNSAYTKNWLEERYYLLIKKIADQTTASENTVIFKVTSSLPVAKKPKPPVQSEALFADEESPLPEADNHRKLTTANLNPRYTFLSFVVGNNNRLAHAVAQAITASPAKAYNPFFIYGGVGVGKTHLMHAIGHEIIRQFQFKVLYCTSEAFTNEMIEAIQGKKNASFRNKYRGVDVLLIDDIQFIAGRETTQEEFFHTFNELQGKGKQIVMTSDRPPKDIAKLEDRLRSRFEGGMIADIQNPDVDMRQAILLTKCREKNITLPPEVLHYLAENVTSSVRDLEGSLIRLVTQGNLTGQPVDLELAKTVLGIQSAPAANKALNPKKLIDAVCTYFAVKPTDLKSTSRQAHLVLPRQITMYLMRVDLGLQFMKIAELLGKKDHTTIIHGVEKVDNLVKNGGELRGLVEDIRAKLWTDS